MERDQCTRYGKAILFHISRDAKGDARGPDVKWAKTRNGMLIEEEEGGGGSIFLNRKPSLGFFFDPRWRVYVDGIFSKGCFSKWTFLFLFFIFFILRCLMDFEMDRMEIGNDNGKLSRRED